MSTDIILVSYNDKEEIKECITSIEKNCDDYRLIIEDNNPPNENKLYTVAVNAAIKKSSSPYVWLLSSDAIVLPGAQEALIKRFEQCPNAGIVGSMQVDESLDRIRWGGPLQIFPGVHAGGFISKGNCLEAKKIIWQNFASTMLKRTVIQHIGLLDEHMKFICSDSDYSLMCRYRGYDIWYEPDSRVIHKLKGSKQPTEWHQKDMAAFMEKWGIVPSSDGNGYMSGHLFHKLNSVENL
jgi:GT2 family glycosyltransferase